MKRFDARKAIKEELATMGLLRGTRAHAMKIPVCSRSGDIVECLLREQWLVDNTVMYNTILSQCKMTKLKC